MRHKVIAAVGVLLVAGCFRPIPNPPPTTTATPPTTTVTTTTTTPPRVCPSSTPNTPGGLDGGGGCFPGSSNTGPAVAPTIVYNGSYMLSDSAVIDGKVINMDLLVLGKNVVIRNSVVNGTIEVRDPTSSLRVEDSEIHGGDAYWATIRGYNYDIVRSEIEGGQQASICSGGCDWTDVYSHNPHYFPNQDAHQSAWATTGVENGQGMSVRHSTLWCNVQPAPSGGGCTGDVALQSDFGEITNVTLNGNLLPIAETGSYCLTGGYWPQKPYSHPSNVVITNNVFGRKANGKCGVYGTVDAWNPNAPGAVFSGNKYIDGTAVTPNS